MSKSPLLFLFLVACVSPQSDPEPDPTPDASAEVPLTNVPGKHVHTLDVDGLTREVIVYVPELDDEVAAVPAVLMLHGTSGDGERFYEISGWKEKADEVGLIAVFPSALTHCFHEDENRDGDFDDAGERKLTTKWASGALGAAEKPLCTADELADLSTENRARADHPLADDLAFARAILELLATEYVVDDRRVYASGFSNGGEMSARLAMDMSEELAATAAAAGGVDQEIAAPARSISMVYSVGTLDDRFLETAAVTEIPIDDTAFTEVPAIGGSVYKYLQMLQLSETHTYSETLVGGKKVGTWLFEDSLVGADNTFTFALIEDLYHQYPNGSNHPVNAPNALWSFFETQSLP